MGMRYYPKRGFGIHLDSFDTNVLDDFEYQIDELLSEGKEDEAAELEDQGLSGTWNRDVLTAIRDWSGDHYDEEVFDAFRSWHEVEPMWVGELVEERGGEINGVSGFTDGQYIIFDPREQSEEKWEAFKKLLQENDIELIEGSWSQLG
jgi:hypothetical protein